MRKILDMSLTETRVIRLSCMVHCLWNTTCDEVLNPHLHIQPPAIHPTERQFLEMCQVQCLIPLTKIKELSWLHQCVHQSIGNGGNRWNQNGETLSQLMNKYSGIYYILSSIFDMPDNFLIRLDININYLFFQAKELDLIDAYNAREATPWCYYA